VRTTSAESENFNDDDEQWLAELETRAIDLENEVSFWRERRQRAHPEYTQVPEATPGPPHEGLRPTTGDRASPYRARPASEIPAATRRARGYAQPRATGRQHSAQERTKGLIDHGRRSAHRTRIPRWLKMTIGIAIVAVIAAILMLVVLGRSASWPASVAVVQNEISTACQNPDVASEPNQVNFACAKATSQILWVFALMTSGDNPNFTDGKSGRQGLEPIMPTQGGEVAWSLNLHHPYNPYSPIDSLEVAARAINNIIGGATLTGSNGKPAVQPGLESSPANCARYTGSSAVISRAGFPDVCAVPVTGAQGQAVLVADVYQQWLVGASSVAAHDASVLFQNAGDPGSPQVQAILKTLPGGAQ
jgi:hypothetical protein